MHLMKHARGRPPKFGRPSHAVTLTLPEDVLARLRNVDADLGRAIVTVVERGVRKPRRASSRPAEIASYGNHAVIVVSPGRVLRRLRGVQLVPAGQGRALIALEHSSSIAHFELELRDAVDRRDITAAERETLAAVIDILRRARQSRDIAVEERSIIVLASKRRRASK
jgi:hypothetical protein